MRVMGTVLSRGTSIVGLLASLAYGGPVFATDWPAETHWVGIAVDGSSSVTDDRGDLVLPYSSGTDGALDCVGNSSGLPDGSPQSAVLWYAEPDTLFFRIRLDSDPSEAPGTWAVYFAVADPADTSYEFGIKATRARPGTDDRDTTVYWVDNRETTSSSPHWQDPHDLETELGRFADLTRVVEVVDGGEQFGLDPDYFFDVQVPRDAVDFALTDQIELFVAAGTGGDRGIASSATDADLCGISNAPSAGTPPDLADVWSAPVFIDADRDGLTDPEEVRYGTDPTSDDSDGDGLEDGREVNELGTNPANSDSDNDGIPDGDEYEAGTDPLNSDSDGDGLSDGTEASYGTDPTRPDSDGDGITDTQEYDCNPERRRNSDDLDEDGLPDAEEQTADRDDDGLADFCDPDDDGDGMLTADEIQCGSDPYNPDTDGDGIMDGDESCESDSDGDGTLDIFDDTDNPGPGGGVGDDATRLDTLSGGRFAGGSCSVSGAPWSAAGHALIALLVVVSRRRRLAGLFLSGTATATPALAQDLNAQTFTPAVGEQQMVRVRSSASGSDGGGLSLLYNHAVDPLVYRKSNGTEIPILGTIGTLNVQGWTAARGLRVGFDLPVHPLIRGYGVEPDSPPRLGDLSADIHYQVLNHANGPLGVGIYGGVIAPTGDGRAWVGDPGAGAYLATSLTRPTGPVLWSANIGYEGRSAVTLPDDTVWGPRVPFGVGGTVDANDLLSLSAEVYGEVFTGPQAPGRGVPLEGLATALVQVSPRWTLRGGIAKGLSAGLGTPDFRALVGAHAVFIRGDADDDEGPSAAKGPHVTTHVKVLSSTTGASVGGATIELKDGPDGAGRVTVPPDAGVELNLRRSMTYYVNIRAPGYHALDAPIEVPAAADGEWFTSLYLTPLTQKCTATFEVRDLDGRPVVATVQTVPNGAHRIETAADTGAGSISLPVGDAYEVVVSAPGFSPDHLAVACRQTPAGEVVHIARSVILRPPRARLDGARIAIDDRIQFETNSDIIDARSKGVLDDVARVLVDHPEVELIEIRGHTDRRGSDVHNLDLSTRRAAAVKAYLIALGIEKTRLDSIGFGESKPLDPSESEAAHETNRRVEFFVERVSAPAE